MDDDPDKAFQRIWQQRRFSTADFDRIVKSALEGGYGTNCLTLLGRRYPLEVFNALRDASTSGDVQHRRMVVTLLSKWLDRAAVNDLLATLITGDPGAEIRSYAAWRAAQLRRTELSELITRQAESETGKSGEVFRMACDVMRDGYAIEQDARGFRSIWVLTYRSGLLSTTLPKEAVTQQQIEAVVDRVKQWQVR